MLRLLFVLMIALSSPAMAQETLNIAVVDVQQLMNASDAARSIQSQGRDLMKKYQAEMKKMSESLKDSEEKVKKAQQGDSKEKFDAQLKAFREELQESQSKAQEYKQKTDEAVADALNVLREEIVKIVNGMTVENGYDLVLTRMDVITVSKDIDITADVMEQLNDRLSTVKVKG